jgi:hypothetical protein
MRSYIFTVKERETINRFFEGKAKLGDDIMREIVWRLRSFKDLASDVELYIRLRKAISTVST